MKLAFDPIAIFTIIVSGTSFKATKAETAGVVGGGLRGLSAPVPSTIRSSRGGSSLAVVSPQRKAAAKEFDVMELFSFDGAGLAMQGGKQPIQMEDIFSTIEGRLNNVDWSENEIDYSYGGNLTEEEKQEIVVTMMEMVDHEGVDESPALAGIYDWDHYDAAPCQEKVVVDAIEFAFSAISGVRVGRAFAIALFRKLGHGGVRATIRDLSRDMNKDDSSSVLRTSLLIFRNVWDALSWRSIGQALRATMNWKDIALLTASIVAQINPLWKALATALLVVEFLFLMKDVYDCLTEPSPPPATNDDPPRVEIDWKCCLCEMPNTEDEAGYCTGEGFRMSAGGPKTCDEICGDDFGLELYFMWWHPWTWFNYKKTGFCADAHAGKSYSMCS